jgi:hypothetical protein
MAGYCQPLPGRNGEESREQQQGTDTAQYLVSRPAELRGHNQGYRLSDVAAGCSSLDNGTLHHVAACYDCDELLLARCSLSAASDSLDACMLVDAGGWVACPSAMSSFPSSENLRRSLTTTTTSSRAYLNMDAGGGGLLFDEEQQLLLSCCPHDEQPQASGVGEAYANLVKAPWYFQPGGDEPLNDLLNGSLKDIIGVGDEAKHIENPVAVVLPANAAGDDYSPLAVLGEDQSCANNEKSNQRLRLVGKKKSSETEGERPAKGAGGRRTIALMKTDEQHDHCSISAAAGLTKREANRLAVHRHRQVRLSKLG